VRTTLSGGEGGTSLHVERLLRELISVVVPWNELVYRGPAVSGPSIQPSLFDSSPVRREEESGAMGQIASILVLRRN